MSGENSSVYEVKKKLKTIPDLEYLFNNFQDMGNLFFRVLAEPVQRLFAVYLRLILYE